MSFVCTNFTKGVESQFPVIGLSLVTKPELEGLSVHSNELNCKEKFIVHRIKCTTFCLIEEKTDHHDSGCTTAFRRMHYYLYRMYRRTPSTSLCSDNTQNLHSSIVERMTRHCPHAPLSLVRELPKLFYDIKILKYLSSSYTNINLQFSCSFTPDPKGKCM